MFQLNTQGGRRSFFLVLGVPGWRFYPGGWMGPAHSGRGEGAIDSIQSVSPKASLIRNTLTDTPGVVSDQLSGRCVQAQANCTAVTVTLGLKVMWCYNQDLKFLTLTVDREGDRTP